MKYIIGLGEKMPFYTSLEKGRKQRLICPINVHRITGLLSWDAIFDIFQIRLKSLHDNTCDSSIRWLSKIKPKCCSPENINHGSIYVVNNCQDMYVHNTNPLKRSQLQHTLPSTSNFTTRSPTIYGRPPGIAFGFNSTILVTTKKCNWPMLLTK
jgi:hypothetical protein